MHRFVVIALALVVVGSAIALPHTARADGAVSLETTIGANNVRLLTQTFGALSQVLANLNAYVASHPNMTASERQAIVNILAGLNQSLAGIARTIAILDARPGAVVIAPPAAPEVPATTTEPSSPIISAGEEQPASETAPAAETGSRGWVLPTIIIGILAVAIGYLMWRGSRRKTPVLASSPPSSRFPPFPPHEGSGTNAPSS